MSKFILKNDARAMRKKGFSILDIAKKLHISKSTASIWCRDIELSETQIKRLIERQGQSQLKGRLKGAMLNKQRRLHIIEQSNNQGMDSMGKLTDRDMLVVAVALYWAEGSKTDSTGGFVFVNSDPEMIKIMNHFLIHILNVPKKDISCRIQINRIHEPRINTVLKFWKKMLDLQSLQMKKPYYIDTKVSKVYPNHNRYFGVCRLGVAKSSRLKYKMLGLIQALKSNILSA